MVQVSGFIWTLNKSLWLHYAPLYYEFQYYPNLGMFPDGHHFVEVYKDQNLAGIWLEAGAAIAMIITATVFLPRYMSLGALVKWAWAAWGSSTWKAGASVAIWYMICMFWDWPTLYTNMTQYGYGSIPIDTIFSGMNIHLPAILRFTRYQGFDPSPYELTNMSLFTLLECIFDRCLFDRNVLKQADISHRWNTAFSRTHIEMTVRTQLNWDRSDGAASRIKEGLWKPVSDITPRVVTLTTSKNLRVCCKKAIRSTPYPPHPWYSDSAQWDV